MHFFEHVPFKTSIFSSNLDIDNDACITKIREIKEKTQGKIISNRGGWQSADYFAKDLAGELSVFQPIIDSIGNELAELYRMYGIKLPARLDNLWFNINRRYNYNATHVHQGSFFSGTVYFKVPNNSGKIVFDRPDSSSWCFPVETSNERNWQTYSIDPTKQNVILFPSYIPHCVEQNITLDEDDERISMAFNFSR
jgi:uncharacterized protein (TIGR02466 family)